MEFSSTTDIARCAPGFFVYDSEVRCFDPCVLPSELRIWSSPVGSAISFLYGTFHVDWLKLNTAVLIYKSIPAQKTEPIVERAIFIGEGLVTSVLAERQGRHLGFKKEDPSDPDYPYYSTEHPWYCWGIGEDGVPRAAFVPPALFSTGEAYFDLLTLTEQIDDAILTDYERQEVVKARSKLKRTVDTTAKSNGPFRDREYGEIKGTVEGIIKRYQSENKSIFKCED